MIRSVEMMQTARRASAAALLAATLAAPGAHGEDAPAPARFRLFPESAAPAESKPAGGTADAVADKKEKRFWLAAGELLAVEATTWGYNRYVADQPYARISWQSVQDNVRVGFAYDNDKFTTNQLGHSFGGSFYYNAARSNGFTFYESALFTFAGSALWEIAAETQGPSLNDLVNTTLGGMVTGEASHRLAQALLDDRARGGERIGREALAGLVDPVQLFTRLLTGDLWAVRPERGPYLRPSRFVAEIDGGWRHVVPDRAPDADQTVVSILARYGDPFDRTVSRPFDAFELRLEASSPNPSWLTRLDIQGLLAGRDLDGSGPARHLLAVLMEFDYTNTDTRVFSAQLFRFGLLSKRPLGAKAELRTEALAVVAPLAAVKNDYLAESSGIVGRAFDYGPGAGASAALRVRRRELDLATLAYAVLWTHTSNGISRSNTLQSFRAEARIPVAGAFAVGGSWGWERRLTTYDEFDTTRTDATQWRAFASWIFR